MRAYVKGALTDLNNTDMDVRQYWLFTHDTDHAFQWKGRPAYIVTQEKTR